jgi:hypothetical protein
MMSQTFRGLSEEHFLTDTKDGLTHTAIEPCALRWEAWVRDLAVEWNKSSTDFDLKTTTNIILQVATNKPVSKLWYNSLDVQRLDNPKNNAKKSGMSSPQLTTLLNTCRPEPALLAQINLDYSSLQPLRGGGGMTN